MTGEVNTREALMSIASGKPPFSTLTIGTDTCYVCGVVVAAEHRDSHTQFHMELTQLARVAITLMNMSIRTVRGAWSGRSVTSMALCSMEPERN